MATGGSENPIKAMSDSLTCSLCMDIFINPRVLPCHHAYCRDCLDKHIVASVRARQIRCPLCNINTTVPQNGVDGFPVAFHQAGQVEILNQMIALNLSSTDTLTGGSNTRVADIPTRTPTRTGGPGKRVADIPTRTPTPHTVTARKLDQFDVDFCPGGITCTPAGNIVVCYGSNTVKMYTPEGNKVMDLQTPPGTEAWDVDSTDTNIYVTGRKTESVLVFDHQGRLVTTNKTNNVKKVSGISVSNRRVYISGYISNNVLEIDLSDTNKLSTQRQFAAGVQLNCPLFVCARGDVVAISSNEDHCVHCVDSRGRIKYTHGTPGQSGRSQYQLYYPRGVVFDRHNNLFISDSFNHKVCVVSDSGRLLGHIDLREHQLQSPRGITIDNEGNLLVTCDKAGWNNHCYSIVKFGYSLQ